MLGATAPIGRSGAHGNRWGPYRSERAWGTVREDDSSYGMAWEYFPHDHARSRVIARARAIAALCLITTADPDARGMWCKPGVTVLILQHEPIA
jgi:hypothetical protein